MPAQGGHLPNWAIICRASRHLRTLQDFPGGTIVICSLSLASAKVGRVAERSSSHGLLSINEGIPLVGGTFLLSFYCLVFCDNTLLLVVAMTFLKSATLALAALLPLTNAVPTARADDGSWDAAHAKAATALAKLSLEDKVKMVTGEGWMKGPCVGTTAEISSIGYPQLCLQDGPLGIRFAQGITAFPAGVQAASTWDIDLINARGNALGRCTAISPGFIGAD